MYGHNYNNNYVPVHYIYYYTSGYNNYHGSYYGNGSNHGDDYSWDYGSGGGSQPDNSPEEVPDNIENNLNKINECIFNKITDLKLFKSTIGAFDKNAQYHLKFEQGVLKDCGNMGGVAACTDAENLKMHGTITIWIIGKWSASF